TGPARTGPHAYPATRKAPAAPTDTTTATAGRGTRSTRARGDTRSRPTAARSSGRADGCPCVAPTVPTSETTASTTARNTRGRRRSSGPMRRTLRRGGPGRVRPGCRAASSPGVTRASGVAARRCEHDRVRAPAREPGDAPVDVPAEHPRPDARGDRGEPAGPAAGAVPPGRARAAGRVGREPPAAREVLEEPRAADHAHPDVRRRVVGDVLAHHRQAAAVPGERAHALRGRGRAVQEALVPHERVPAQPDVTGRLRDRE